MQARIDFLLGVVDGNMGRVQRAIVYYPHILGSKLQTLETNAEVLLQHWFQGNNTSFQEGVLKAPNALTRNTELTQRRIEQVLQLGLNYESHANLNFLMKTEDTYGTWLGNRQEEAKDRRVNGC